MSLLRELDDMAELVGVEVDERFAHEYWKAAQRPLAIAISLAQQGSEFLLKARIAGVSPFLLLSGDPSDWPSGCDKQNIQFASFRTIDAQDLIRAHDAVSSPRLSDEFKTRYDELRRLRNTIMHTIDRQLRVMPDHVLETILEISNSLLGSRQWIERRREFLRKDQWAVVSERSGSAEPEHIQQALVHEIMRVVGLLKPGQLEHFFGLNKGQRRYMCPYCTYVGHYDEGPVDAAQLRPNTPTSTIVYCFLCNREQAVVRQSCGISECKGNVFDAEDGWCLTCGECSELGKRLPE